MRNVYVIYEEFCTRALPQACFKNFQHQALHSGIQRGPDVARFKKGFLEDTKEQKKKSATATCEIVLAETVGPRLQHTIPFPPPPMLSITAVCMC